MMLQRSLYIDNLKSLLIFLVVYGHFISIMQENTCCGIIYNCIYSFHMPLFVFVSGYLSKNIDRQRLKDVDKVLFPYLIFQLIGYFIYSKGNVFHRFNVFLPLQQNWYILALFVWRMMLPYTRLFKARFVIIFSIIVAFYVGLFPEFGRFFTIHRIFYFFPLFLLGSCCEDLEEKLIYLQKHKAFLMITLLIALIAIGTLTAINGKLHNAIIYAFRPSEAYLSITGFLLRVIGFVSSIIISLCFVVSTYNMLSTRKLAGGGKTLLVYLSHFFVVFLFNPLMIYIGDIPAALLSIFFAIGLCYILTLNPVDRFFAPLMSLSSFCDKFKINILR